MQAPAGAPTLHMRVGGWLPGMDSLERGAALPGSDVAFDGMSL
jgi:hypothetical protein